MSKQFGMYRKRQGRNRPDRLTVLLVSVYISNLESDDPYLRERRSLRLHGIFSLPTIQSAAQKCSLILELRPLTARVCNGVFQAVS